MPSLLALADQAQEQASGGGTFPDERLKLMLILERHSCCTPYWGWTRRASHRLSWCNQRRWVNA